MRGTEISTEAFSAQGEAERQGAGGLRGGCADRGAYALGLGEAGVARAGGREDHGGGQAIIGRSGAGQQPERKRKEAKLEPYHWAWLSVHPERDEAWLRARLRDGFHVHHIDVDHGNNAPSNLVLIEAGDHFGLHGGRPSRRPATRQTKIAQAPCLPLSPEHFGDMLHKLRWGQAELGRRLGISANSVSAWATGGIAVPKYVEEYLRVCLLFKEGLR